MALLDAFIDNPIEFVRKASAGSQVTVGFEIEFYSPSASEALARLPAPLNPHVDHYSTLEVQTPPVGIDSNYLAIFNEIEDLVRRVGKRVSDYYDPNYDRSHTCGTHVHVRVAGSVSGWAKMMARLHNWLVVLAAALGPMITMGRMYDAVNNKVLEIEHERYGFRSRVRHYNVVPLMISSWEVAEFERSSPGSRGYIPIGNNDWFAVELNKYRKNVTTIEVRLNETHWLAGYALVYAAWELAKKTAPPFIDIVKLYRLVVPVYVEVDPLNGVVEYSSDVRIADAKTTVTVWKPDKLLFTRKGKQAVMPVEVAEKVLSIVDLPEPVAKVLGALAKGRRLTYDELHTLASRL